MYPHSIWTDILSALTTVQKVNTSTIPSHRFHQFTVHPLFVAISKSFAVSDEYPQLDDTVIVFPETVAILLKTSTIAALDSKQPDNEKDVAAALMLHLPSE